MIAHRYPVLRRFGLVLLPLLIAGFLPSGAVGQRHHDITVPALHLKRPFLPAQHYGPYNAHILVGGRGLTKSLPAKDPIFEAATPWTLSAWVQFATISPSSVLIAGAGDPFAEDSRYFALIDGKLALRIGDTASLVSSPEAL
ncbi:MAG TPA: hypothetical protein VMU92_02715 [Acidobacteriaceae bacterium]|nr:hypothetical protein [Acidobacteriaceae bacterium]